MSSFGLIIIFVLIKLSSCFIFSSSDILICSDSSKVIFLSASISIIGKYLLPNFIKSIFSIFNFLFCIIFVILFSTILFASFVPINSFVSFSMILIPVYTTNKLIITLPNVSTCLSVGI